MKVETLIDGGVEKFVSLFLSSLKALKLRPTNFPVLLGHNLI
jgi:hypothetical protein